jgi:CopG family nickel-responsive transcriptional regulator
MQRVTITLDDALMDELDAIMAARGYQNRSEAIRDLARAGIREAAEDVSSQKRDCVAALVYTYDHAARQLSKRLTSAYHEHHELSLASLHVHLDHDTCLEVTVLRGKTDDVQHFGEHVIAERGVRHGKIVRMPFEPAKERKVSHGHHGHHGHHHAHGHDGPRPARRAKRLRKAAR